MEQDDSYAWNRTTVMAGICERVSNFPPAIQTPTTFMHVRTSKFFCIANFSHNIQASRRSPKEKEKKGSIYVRGEEGIKIFERHTFFGRRFGEE
jgi:hypothetical protein